MEESPKCQLFCVKPMAEGTVRYIPKSPIIALKVMLHRSLSLEQKRAIKKFVDSVRQRITRRRQPVAKQEMTPATGLLKPGDLVRVRSEAEILATLGAFRSLKGLAFMPEMAQYCGTTQRVFKLLNRFFDERDYQIRRAKGIILLEGVMCQGTALYGPCDRSCFYFWREEWLEKIDGEAEGV